MWFSTVTGLDARLLFFVPLATLFTPALLAITAGIINGPAVASIGATIDLWAMNQLLAIFLMPLFVPPAIISWVAARVLCWKVGLGEYSASILSGFISGLGSTAIPALVTGNNALSGSIVIGVPAAISGMLAAAIIYWKGWARWRSGKGIMSITSEQAK